MADVMHTRKLSDLLKNALPQKLEPQSIHTGKVSAGKGCQCERSMTKAVPCAGAQGAIKSNFAVLAAALRDHAASARA